MVRTTQPQVLSQWSRISQTSIEDSGRPPRSDLQAGYQAATSVSRILHHHLPGLFAAVAVLTTDPGRPAACCSGALSSKISLHAADSGAASSTRPGRRRHRQRHHRDPSSSPLVAALVAIPIGGMEAASTWPNTPRSPGEPSLSSSGLGPTCLSGSSLDHRRRRHLRDDRDQPHRLSAMPTAP